MIDRIRELMDHKRLTSSQFADTVDVPRAVISHILSGRNKPSLEVVTKIVAAFEDVSIAWLLLGEGDMLIPLVVPVAPEIKPSDIENTEPAPKESEIKSAEDTGKVQSGKFSAQAPVQVDMSGKSIEQIVIFYSDKTFTAYKP